MQQTIDAAAKAFGPESGMVNRLRDGGGIPAPAAGDDLPPNNRGGQMDRRDPPPRRNDPPPREPPRSTRSEPPPRTFRDDPPPRDDGSQRRVPPRALLLPRRRDPDPDDSIDTSLRRSRNTNASWPDETASADDRRYNTNFGRARAVPLPRRVQQRRRRVRGEST